MLVPMVQFGVRDHATPANLLQPLAAILIAAWVGGMTIVLLRKPVPWLRRRRRAHSEARRRLLHSATAERRARAMMDELCPDGWRAELVLAGGSDDRRRLGRREGVVLDWCELDRDGRCTGPVRRVAASTVAAALVAMVEDRRTDETLQSIERAALEEGILWPEG